MQRRRADEQHETKTDLPSSVNEEIAGNMSEKKDQREENRREADLEDKKPAGDTGPEEE